jgi:hypothetical protein
MSVAKSASVCESFDEIIGQPQTYNRLSDLGFVDSSNFDCTIDSLPFTYLGLLLDLNKSVVKRFSPTSKKV